MFTVDSISLAGDPILSKEKIFDFIEVKKGDTFSQLNVTMSSDALEKQLGNEGYSAANVRAVPSINQSDKTVDLTFYITPGQISYVRRVIFSGNVTTADHVLRREMRQLEGAPVSSEKLELSRARLQRLGLFGEVKLLTKEVPGTNDQIDVEFVVTEQPTASVNFSLGYSNNNGVSVGAGLQHNNWLGTGNTFGVNIERNDTETNYSLNFRNPYYTENGVSRGISLFFRERDFDDIDISSYATNTLGMRVTFGYPISETSRLALGLGIANIDVKAGTTVAQEIQGTPLQEKILQMPQSVRQTIKIFLLT